MQGDLQRRWGEAWYFFKHQWWALTKVLLPVALPVAAWTEWAILHRHGEVLTDMTIQVPNLISSLVIVCLMVSQIDQLVRGQPFSWAKAWQCVLARGPRLFAAQAMMLLLVFGGLNLLIVPGVFLLGRLLMVLVVVPLSDNSPLADMRRAYQLSAGGSWRVLVGFLGLSALAMLPGALLGEVGLAMSSLGMAGQWLWMTIAHLLMLLFNQVALIYLYREYELSSLSFAKATESP